jgi:hypothetical protein
LCVNANAIIIVMLQLCANLALAAAPEALERVELLVISDVQVMGFCGRR